MNLRRFPFSLFPFPFSLLLACQAAAAKTPDPDIQVTLNRPIYFIHCDPATGAPQMPTDVIATAQALHWPNRCDYPTTFTWRVTLRWNYMGCHTRHDIGKRRFIQPSPLKVDLGDQIRGGTLTVTAHAKYRGDWIVGVAKAQVLGENPQSQTVLRTFPVSRFGLIASKIAAWESGLRQFTLPDRQQPGGLPYTSPTGDIGLMQLNAPTGAISNQDQIWDWRANVRRGLAILEDKRLDSYRAAMKGVGLWQWGRPLLSEAPGSGILAGDPDVDHVELSQVERDFIRRYNAGHEYTYLPARGGYSRRGGWRLDVSRGGLSRDFGDPDYVRHVLRSHSGFTWPPAHTRHRTRHRRRHHRHHGLPHYDALPSRRTRRTLRQQINTTL